MTETIIVDLAILQHDTKHCPVCNRLLTMSTALYRYPHKQRIRTSYIKVLSCPSCKQYFGTYELLNNVRASDSSGNRNSKMEILPYHIFNESLAPKEPTARNFSKVETRERVVQSSIFDRKTKKQSMQQRQKAEFQQIVRAEKIESGGILETSIAVAPPPTQGPVAVVKDPPSEMEQSAVPHDEENSEIYDLTVLAPYTERCPKCKAQLGRRTAQYHYLVNKLPRVYIGVLSFCDTCKKYYGTIEWLDSLEKRLPDDEIVFQYHYYGMPSLADDAEVYEVSQTGGYLPRAKSILSTSMQDQRYQMKTFEEALKATNGPDDAILILQYSSEENPYAEETLFIVKNQKLSSGTKRIYFINSPLGNAVIEAILMNSRVFHLNGFQYTINNVYKHRNFDEAVAARERIMRVLQHPKEMVDVYVYELKGLCRRHGDLTEKLIVNMISSRSQEPHPLEVYYCPRCRKFYVNYETYLRFYRRYGMPPLRLYGDSEKSGAENQYASLRQHSDLNLFGYTVSGALGENEVFRHALLEDIIDSGNLTKAQVTSHLEWLIRFGKNNEKMFFARMRWQNDLEYVENYQPVRTNIFGTFKPGKTKVFL